MNEPCRNELLLFLLPNCLGIPLHSILLPSPTPTSLKLRGEHLIASVPGRREPYSYALRERPVLSSLAL